MYFLNPEEAEGPPRRSVGTQCRAARLPSGQHGSTGNASRYVEEAKKRRTALETLLLSNFPDPSTELLLEHSCPIEKFSEIPTNFFHLIYPVLPLVHQPWFLSQPTTELLTCLLMLATASHHAPCSDQGWAFANEVMLFTRSMAPREARGYENLSRMV